MISKWNDTFMLYILISFLFSESARLINVSVEKEMQFELIYKYLTEGFKVLSKLCVCGGGGGGID